MTDYAEPMPSAPEVEATERANYASWGRRAVALIVDSLLLALVAGLLALLGYAIGGGDGAAILGYLMGGLVVPIFYYTYFWGGESGQTIASRWFGIRMRSDRDGGPIGYGKGFGRYLIVILLGIVTIPLIVSYLWPL